MKKDKITFYFSYSYGSRRFAGAGRVGREGGVRLRRVLAPLKQGPAAPPKGGPPPSLRYGSRRGGVGPPAGGLVDEP